MYVAVASVIAFAVFIGVFIQMMFTAQLSWSNLSLAVYMYLKRQESI